MPDLAVISISGCDNGKSLWTLIKSIENVIYYEESLNVKNRLTDNRLVKLSTIN